MDDLEESITESSFVSDGSEDENENRLDNSINDGNERDDYDDNDEEKESEVSAYNDDENDEESEEIPEKEVQHEEQHSAVDPSPRPTATSRGSSLSQSSSSSKSNIQDDHQHKGQTKTTTDAEIFDSTINAPPSPRLISDHNQNGSNRSMRSSGSGSNGGSTPRRTSSRSGGVNIGGYDHQLSWKSDPLSSFSDWRIEIQITEDDAVLDIDEEASNSSRRRRRSRITRPTSNMASSSSSSDSNNLIVYHIHRNIVGFGPRRSDYLTRMFRKHAHQQQKRKSTATTYRNGGATSTDDNKNAKEDNVTNLQLKKSLANVFPMVLDFIYYSKSTKSMMSSEKACLVFKASEVLEIPALQNSIVEFYRKNVSLKNMNDFISNAINIKVPRLELVAKAQIGSLITEKPALAGLLPPKFLEDILRIGRQQFLELQQSDPNKYTAQMECTQSKHWSKVAFICVSHNKSILTLEMFSDIFSEELLPAIDSSIALRVLSLEYQLQKQQQQQEGSNISSSSPSASVNSSFSSSSTSLRSSQQTYTNLQKRCVTSITSDWQNFTSNFDSSEDNNISAALKALPSHVLADILVKSMNKS